MNKNSFLFILCLLVGASSFAQTRRNQKFLRPDSTVFSAVAPRTNTLRTNTRTNVRNVAPVTRRPQRSVVPANSGNFRMSLTAGYQQKPPMIQQPGGRFWSSLALMSSAQAIALELMYLHEPGVRENFSFSNVGRNLRNPQIGSNNNFKVVDYLGHPYKDAQSYLLFRNKTRNHPGSGVLSAWAFSVFESAVWEFGYEATYCSEADRKDLITGAVSGLVVGEAIHQLTLQLEKNGLSTPEKVVVLVLNPFHIVQDWLKI